MKPILLLLFLQTCIALNLYAGIDSKRITIQGAGPMAVTVPTSDNGCLLIDTSWLLATRLDSLGQILWQKGADQQLNGYVLFDAGQLADSGFYFIYSGYLDNNHLVVKLSANGDFAWADEFTFPNAGFNYVNNCTAKPQPDGGLIFSASLYGKMNAIRLNANGTVAQSILVTAINTVSSKTPGFDAEAGDTGSIVLSGKQDGDIVVMSVNQTGTADWSLYFNNGIYNQLRSVVRLNEGSYLAAGYSRDTFGIVRGVVMKVSGAGSLLWTKYYNVQDAVSNGFYQVMQDNDGVIHLIGLEKASGIDEIVALTVDSSGQPLEAWGYGAAYASLMASAPRMYKVAGVVKTSTPGLDSAGAIVGTDFYPLSVIPSICGAVQRQVSANDMNAQSNLPAANLIITQGPAATHPDITVTAHQFPVSLQQICPGNSMAINEAAVSTNKFSLHPNPATAGTAITVKSNAPVQQVILRDIAGKIIQQVQGKNQSEVIFELLPLSAGVYLMEVQQQGRIKTEVKKLIIE